MDREFLHFDERLKNWQNFSQFLKHFQEVTARTRIEPWWNLNGETRWGSSERFSLELNHGGI